MTTSSSPAAARRAGPVRTRVHAPVPGAGGGVTAVSFRERIGPADDGLEREADRIADAVARDGTFESGRMRWAAASLQSTTVQRKCDTCEEEEAETIRRAPDDAGASLEEREPPEAAPPGESTSPEPGAGETGTPRAAPALLVADDAQADRGQMRQSEFMAALRAGVCATVDAGLSGSGRDSEGCPWIDHWLGFYEGRGATQIERSLLRYAPEARAATAAPDYIRFVTARVRRSADTWNKTGEIEGMPDDLPGNAMPGGALLGAFGGMFFKARPGGARTADAVSVRDQLGSGRSLPGAVRMRMESAFGTSFARVRVHTDASAAHLSDRLNARAFTIGPHVAFAGGEFRPGTIAGDALIAHELAHVVQQGQDVAQDAHSRAVGAPQMKGGPADSALEHDADTAAVGAVVALWGGAKEHGRGVAARTMPGLRSGLRLQRCGDSKKKEWNLQTDKALRARWEAAFQEGLKLLNAAARKKGGERGCSFPGGPRETWQHDQTNWKLILNEGEVRFPGGAYVSLTGRPHTAVDELFSHPERWECDCALFTELTWLYAWRHALPDDEFDEKFKELRLRKHDSAGMPREHHVGENYEDPELEKGDFKADWNNAPIGTKVSWVNNSEIAHPPWKHEHAVKSRKGDTPDEQRYDAHPLGSNLSESEVKLGLARNSEDFPVKEFKITDQTLGELDAPPAFIDSLMSLKDQVFVGKSAFLDALAGPLEGLPGPRQRAGVRAQLLYSAQVIPADAPEYVDKYIKRYDIQIPK